MATKRKPAAKAGPKRKRAMVALEHAEIEVERVGKGKPLLLLQSEDAYESTLPLIDHLAKTREVILPWAPGYGRSSLPDSVTSIMSS